MSYASGTSVPVERSKAELDRLLAKAGADQRMIGSDDAGGFAFCVFALDKRRVRLRVPLPKRDERRFTHDTRCTWKRRTAAQALQRWEQGCRERWRGLVLLVKAKLEAIAIGISTAEREFLADTFLPDGRTVHEALADEPRARVPRRAHAAVARSSERERAVTRHRNDGVICPRCAGADPAWPTYLQYSSQPRTRGGEPSRILAVRCGVCGLTWTWETQRWEAARS